MRPRWRVLGAAALAVAGFGSGCRPVPPHVADPERVPSVVRVGLAVGTADVVVRARGEWRGRSAEGPWTVRDGASLRCVARGGRVVAILDDGVEYSDPQALLLEPETDDAQLVVGTTPYRGKFAVRLNGGKLTLIETLDIETYLRGVVGWEIGWLAADLHTAAEVQAIAARTYTMSRLGQFDAQGFDVYADERDQVYRGALREDPVIDRAISTTRGQVLRYGGELIHAYYSSTCGGFTSWVENVWPKPAAPYLRGHRDANAQGRSYCSGSRHFRWTETWDGAELQRTLQETVPRILQLPADTRLGRVTDLRIVRRDASARVLDLQVVTDARTYDLHGDPIRWVLRPKGRTLLRSLMFTLDVQRDGGTIVRVRADGGGNGHGVGMCQTGAMAMAAHGMDREQILEHYYPGVRIERAY